MVLAMIHADFINKEAMLKTPKTIGVFEGGGAKGLAYAGAYGIAKQQGMTFDKVAGSSAGGITAFLIATGHSAQEIEKIMMELDLTLIQDSTPFVQAVNSTVNFTNSTAKVLVPAYGLTRYAIGSEIPLQPGDALATVSSLLQTCFTEGTYTGGAWQGKKFLELARNFLSAKIGKEDITFAELHQLKMEHPEFNLASLYLTGTDADTGETVVFSHEDPQTRNVSIVDALRATMSFPFAFKAHEITINGKVRRFIDGGVKKNFPMDIFDLKNPQGERSPNPAVIGFKVDDKEECKTLLFKEGIPDKVKKIGDFTAVDQISDVYNYYRYNTVQIYDADIWTLDFDLDPLAKYILKSSGEESMKAFLKDGYQRYSMHDNQLVCTLMNIRQALKDGDYLKAHQGLVWLEVNQPKHIVAVAKICIEIMEQFKIAGLKPGAMVNYETLSTEAHRMAQVKPQNNTVLLAARDGTLTAAGVGVPLAVAGMLNPLTAPVVAAAAGGAILYRFLSSGNHTKEAIPVAYNKEDVKRLITEHHFTEAKNLIQLNIAELNLEVISEFRQHLQSLRTKGWYNQTRAQYDVLDNYLQAEHSRLSNVSADDIIDSFEKLSISTTASLGMK